MTVEGDLNYGPGETQKNVPVRLLELGEKDGLLDDKQIKQFVMDLSNPRVGAKLGRYPRTTITISDQPGQIRTQHFTFHFLWKRFFFQYSCHLCSTQSPV